MKWLLFLFLAACSSSKVNNYLDRYENQSIVITYFQSSDQEVSAFRQNQAKRIAEIFETKIKQLKVVLCPLPEEYDRSAGIALECVSQANANYILGLNYGRSCVIGLETAASNKDHEPDRADSAGVVYTDRVIDPTETAERVGFTWPSHKFYCAINRADREKMKLSVTLDFVANNLAFHLAEHSVKAPFTMITLAPSTCNDQDALLTKAADMLAYHFLEEGISLWRPSAMPANLQETIEMRAALPKHSCEANFLDALEATYQQAQKPAKSIKKSKNKE